MNLQKPLLRRIKVVVVFFIFGCLALGFLCESDSINEAKTKWTGANVFASDTSKFVMCELIQGAEVAKYSPFAAMFIKSEPWPTAHLLQGCKYEFDNADKNDAASICIGVTNFSTAKEAMNSLKGWEKMVLDQELKIETVDSLGNKASTSGDDEVGLNVVIGNRLLTVNLMGQFPQVTAKQKKNAAKALAKLVIARLKLK